MSSITCCIFKSNWEDLFFLIMWFVKFISVSCYICISLGRFDFNKYAVHCRNCNDVTPSWTIRDVVQAGYWPGSPSETSYVFDQQLFWLWDSLQKRMPGTSESSFIRALEDVSAMSGRVLLIFCCSVHLILLSHTFIIIFISNDIC